MKVCSWQRPTCTMPTNSHSKYGTRKWWLQTHIETLNQFEWKHLRKYVVGRSHCVVCEVLVNRSSVHSNIKTCAREISFAVVVVVYFFFIVLINCHQSCQNGVQSWRSRVRSTHVEMHGAADMPDCAVFAYEYIWRRMKPFSLSFGHESFFHWRSSGKRFIFISMCIFLAFASFASHYFLIFNLLHFATGK